ncbi:ATP-binding protein [Kineococcus sp. SYSU DK002]|uniref:ATP-binding protein n=1 Tax=Kineococcus sp. SYSU DK002 TaxID=3383123 RepID=UPI003D7EB5AC
MPTVTLRFSPLAEHVRTARLVAVSVARRAGFGEEQLDEIRIAIGEACARAVAGGALQTPTGPAVGLVDMRLCDDEERLDVTVVQCSADGEPLPDGPGPLATADPLSLALMAGMADSSEPSSQSGGVTLSWRLQAETAPVRAF